MTSFSTYGTGRIRWVDGGLTNENEETRDEQLWMVTHVIAAGAARALLDSATDDNDSDATVLAEDWHTPVEGWELEAIRDSDEPGFMAQVEGFVNANLPNIITLAQFIAWNEDFNQERWHGDDGMGLYRVGMLLGYQCAGVGIGFDDYWYPDSKVVVGVLKSWVEEHLANVWEQVSIDSSEEPCLLHIPGVGGAVL